MSKNMNTRSKVQKDVRICDFFNGDLDEETIYFIRENLFVLKLIDIEGIALSDIQFAVSSNRQYLLPKEAITDGNDLPRITIDTSYTLSVYKEAKLVAEIPFNWVKIELKYQDDDSASDLTFSDKRVEKVRELFSGNNIRLIDADFIAWQIELILNEQLEKINIDLALEDKYSIQEL
ncbi:MAG: hypothetical protein Q9M76_05980 [Candidatus Dojkabacteria bacterium]|nr:hypothetical protein [Candidatus Dojkabacteria bacterium]